MKRGLYDCWSGRFTVILWCCFKRSFNCTSDLHNLRFYCSPQSLKLENPKPAEIWGWFTGGSETMEASFSCCSSEQRKKCSDTARCSMSTSCIQGPTRVKTEAKTVGLLLPLNAAHQGLWRCLQCKHNPGVTLDCSSVSCMLKEDLRMIRYSEW